MIVMKHPIETDLIGRARALAIVAHGNQLYDDKPFVYHLDGVYTTLKRFGMIDEHTLCAAYMHDILEDAPPDLQALYATCISMVFGFAVLETVRAVTNKPGKNRAERHAATYPDIYGGWKKTCLKLADRIANIEACLEYESPLIKMYLKEKDEFRKALHCEGMSFPIEDMWKHLDHLYATVLEQKTTQT